MAETILFLFIGISFASGDKDMIHQKILRVMACAVTVWTLCACGASKTQTDGAQQEKTPAAYAWVADSLKNFTVLDVRETGPRSAKMGVRLDFNNPMSLAFELSQLHAHLLVDGQPCFEITSPGTLIISRKARETYLTEVQVALAEGANVFSVLNVLRSRNRPELTLDFSARVALRGGALGAVIHKTMSLDDYLETERLKAVLAGLSFEYKMLGMTLGGTLHGFDLVFLDLDGQNDASALLEMDLECTNMAQLLPEMHLDASVKVDDRQAFDFASKYDLDIKPGRRQYYIPVTLRQSAEFNPCLLLNLLRDKAEGERYTFKLSMDLQMLLRLPVGSKTLEYKDILLTVR